MTKERRRRRKSPLTSINEDVFFHNCDLKKIKRRRIFSCRKQAISSSIIEYTLPYHQYRQQQWLQCLFSIQVHSLTGLRRDISSNFYSSIDDTSKRLRDVSHHQQISSGSNVEEYRKASTLSCMKKSMNALRYDS